MNTLLLVLALVALLIIAAPFLLALAIAVIAALSPEFNDYDEIVECTACRGDKLGECWGCRYNPVYWVKMSYIGPERWKLPRLRKEWNYMDKNETTCRSCGKRILWIRTRAGKSMPCDAKRVNYRIKPGGPAKVVTPGGDVISCELVTDPAEASGWGYVPHWSTCNAPDKFRRRTK